MEKPVERRYPSVREATEKERVGMVKEIFSTITGKYDFLNHLLSLRRDIAWRRFTAKKMRFGPTNRYLDVACGTGDLCIEAVSMHPAVSVTGVDFVPEMLELGQEKIDRRGLSNRVAFAQGDALSLPFRDGSFDVAGIAFGIRNIPDREKALSEMKRVVVPGGQVMILEMAFTRNWFSEFLYHTYLNRILPRIAKRFSQNPEAYTYLADSIMNFPTVEEFLKLMERAGIGEAKAYKLTFGATYLYEGIKKG
jgi:demethylmenaquinone methyltransferase/2-methoxy-6-polyprenyl-1,4-benzoquinol methylase